MIEFNLNLTGSILDWVNFVRFKTFRECLLCHVRISLSLFVQADMFGEESSKDL